MRAAVYEGGGRVAVRQIPVPEIGPGEILVRVFACGICHTDLKKIHDDLLAPPRVYGHETAGEVAAVGAGVAGFTPGDRVAVFHHIPCRNCFYCARRLFAQCEVYKKVGVTAGYAPAGGGFAEYVRVMSWIVEGGVERIPEGVAFERAAFVEPVNTCLKAVEALAPAPGDVALIAGQGPIGLLFTMLLARRGVRVAATDPMESRRILGESFGAELVWDPHDGPLAPRLRAMTEGRGADLAVVAASAPGLVAESLGSTRPGARVMLFAQTSARERIELSGADICVGERILLGSYSASVDLQKESARLVFGGGLPVEELISHRMTLEEIGAGIDLALHPNGKSLKIIVQPQRWP
jgi:L-iditol 2-dehydrogenase